MKGKYWISPFIILPIIFIFCCFIGTLYKNSNRAQANEIIENALKKYRTFDSIEIVGYANRYDKSNHPIETKTFTLIYRPEEYLYLVQKEDEHNNYVWANKSNIIQAVECIKNKCDRIMKRNSMMDISFVPICNLAWKVMPIRSNSICNQPCIFENSRTSYIGIEDVLGTQCWRLCLYEGWNALYTVWIDCNSSTIRKIRTYFFRKSQIFNVHFPFGQFEHTVLDYLGIDFSSNINMAEATRAYEDETINSTRFDKVYDESLFTASSSIIDGIERKTHSVNENASR